MVYKGNLHYIEQILCNKHIESWSEKIKNTIQDEKYNLVL